MLSFYLSGLCSLFHEYFMTDISNFFFLLWPNPLSAISFHGAYVRHSFLLCLLLLHDIICYQNRVFVCCGIDITPCCLPYG